VPNCDSTRAVLSRFVGIFLKDWACGLSVVRRSGNEAPRRSLSYLSHRDLAAFLAISNRFLAVMPAAPRLSAHAPQRHGGGVLAVLGSDILDLACRDLRDHNRVTGSVGWSLFAFGPLGIGVVQCLAVSFARKGQPMALILYQNRSTGWPSDTYPWCCSGQEEGWDHFHWDSHRSCFYPSFRGPLKNQTRPPLKSN
jgi:hypothetical protein